MNDDDRKLFLWDWITKNSKSFESVYDLKELLKMLEDYDNQRT